MPVWYVCDTNVLGRLNKFIYMELIQGRLTKSEGFYVFPYLCESASVKTNRKVKFAQIMKWQTKNRIVFLEFTSSCCFKFSKIHI